MNNTIMIAYYLGRRKENPKTTIFDQLVCLATKSRYSHLEYVHDYTNITGRGSCWSASPRDDGVRNKVITLDAQNWELYSVETDNMPVVVTSSSMLTYYKQNEHRRYDWVGAFATKIPIIQHSGNRLFCSEAAGAALGIELPQEQTPQSIFDYLAPYATRIPT